MARVPTNAKKVSKHIPDDLAFSLLSKLPLKSLNRFSCAQKSWTLLFQNPYFMTMFRTNFLSANHSLYDDTSVLIKQEMQMNPNEEYDVDSSLYLLSGDRFENRVKLERPRRFTDEEEEESYYWPLDIPGCVNGILCFFEFFDRKGMFWNPATQEGISLHPSPLEFLSFDNTFCTHGFGYDHIRDDYKVIRCVEVSRYTPGDEGEADWTYMPLELGLVWEIYSLRNNTWRKLDVNKYGHQILGYYSKIYLNGVCHWLGKTGEVKYLVSFNLSSEVFVTTPLLLDMHDGVNLKKSSLMVLNGSIAMISKKSKTATFHISILGELGVKESWVEVFIIGPFPFIRCPIGAGKKGEIFFKTKKKKLVCFDLNTQTFEEISLKGAVPWEATIYKENPFPIGGLNK